MATLRDDLRPTQRDIEGVLEDLDPIYRGLDDCEDSDNLESYASTLDSVITRLTYLASDWHRYAAIAEREEEEDECSWCNRPFEEGGGRYGDSSECQECVSSDR